MSEMNHEQQVALQERIAENEKQNSSELCEERSMMVVKANALIQKTRYELNLQEQRILLFLISKIKPGDNELKTNVFSITEFCEICGIDCQESKGMYGYLKETLKTLADKSKWINFDDDSETLVRWIDILVISRKERTIKIALSRTLEPYLLNLSKKFTSYQLLNILPMKSKYSVRLYELLKSYENLGHKKFEVEELKKRINAENYGDVTNFKKRALFPALKDIERYGDIKITAIFIKKKTKITHIEFVISPIKDIQEKIKKWSNIDKKLNRGQM